MSFYRNSYFKLRYKPSGLRYFEIFGNFNAVRSFHMLLCVVFIHNSGRFWSIRTLLNYTPLKNKKRCLMGFHNQSTVITMACVASVSVKMQENFYYFFSFCSSVRALTRAETLATIKADHTGPPVIALHLITRVLPSRRAQLCSFSLISSTHAKLQLLLVSATDKK